MTDPTTMQDDLRYVTNAMRRRDPRAGVPAIFFLWAVIIAIGFALPDFAPQHAWLYWAILGPAGGVVSWLLGARDAKRQGDMDRELGIRHGLHWLVSGAAWFAVALPLLGAGDSEPLVAEALGRQILLVAALAYGLAAVHLERGLGWPAAFMGLGYVVLTTAPVAYTWTLTGALVAIGLVIGGWRARRR